MTPAVRSQPRAPRPAAASQQPADVLVAFGITGDLAKVMTLRSLYRLERRGLLTCPIVGVAVDDWTVDDLRERAREAIVTRRRAARPRRVRPLRRAAVLRRRGLRRPRDVRARGEGDRRRAQPRLLPGDPAVPVRRGGQGARRRGARPRAPASSSRSRSGTTSNPPARSPRSCTSTSTSRRSTGSTTSWGRWGSSRSSTCGSRTRSSSRSGTATTSRRVQITMAESFGVEDRGHFYDPVGALRDVVVNHMMQVVGRGRHGGARGDPGDQGLARARSSARCPPRTPPTTCAASTTAIATSPASRRTPRPRPTRRCGSRSTTGAGRACRSSCARASTCR